MEGAWLSMGQWEWWQLLALMCTCLCGCPQTFKGLYSRMLVVIPPVATTFVERCLQKGFVKQPMILDACVMVHMGAHDTRSVVNTCPATNPKAIYICCLRCICMLHKRIVAVTTVLNHHINLCCFRCGCALTLGPRHCSLS
jgi:hypothetical protein